MSVQLLMVDVKSIVLTHLGHLPALVTTMKYLILQDYSVLVCISALHFIGLKG